MSRITDTQPTPTQQKVLDRMQAGETLKKGFALDPAYIGEDKMMSPTFYSLMHKKMIRYDHATPTHYIYALNQATA